MQASDCQAKIDIAEEKAKEGCNDEATDLFNAAAECWLRWEFFSRAAESFERAYEHAMLCHQYIRASDLMVEASNAWMAQGEHDKFEIDNQIASEAYVYAAEKSKKPIHLIDGAFCAILGGDLDFARHLLHAAAAGARGTSKELVNLALMLSEYHFGDADMYIRAALARVLDRKHMDRVKEVFFFAFVGFVRTSLESETALSLSSLSESTGMSLDRVRTLVERGIRKGYIPAYIDYDSLELVVDPDRIDVSDLTRRRGPILSRDLDDPGAWDIDLED
jgi:hypothetical protein